MRSGVEGRPLVALGGGRVIDSAKAIAGADGLAVAAIPTTLSGAEMTPLPPHARGSRRAGNLVRPSLVIAEPGLMASQPMPGLAASAMNALAHAIEALYTPLANPVAEWRRCAPRELIAAGARPSDPDARRSRSARCLPAMRPGRPGFAVHHASARRSCACAGTPHAQTNAMMLPHFVRMMESRAPDAMTLDGSRARQQGRRRRRTRGTFRAGRSDTALGERDRAPMLGRRRATPRYSTRRSAILPIRPTPRSSCRSLVRAL